MTSWSLEFGWEMNEVVGMEQPISTNQNQFGFSQKNEMYIPGLEMLMHLNEVTIKQIWPGCLERKSNLNYLFGQTIVIICYSLQLGVCPQISGIRWPGQSSLLSKRRIHLLYANMLCQFTRVMKKISELTSLTENSLIFHIVFSRLQVALETNDGIELLRFDRPLRCMECPCDSCYPDMTQVIHSYSTDS